MALKNNMSSAEVAKKATTHRAEHVETVQEAGEKAVAAVARSRRNFKNGTGKRETTLKEHIASFHPSAVKFLKEQLGIDLYKLDKKTVEEIRFGRVTSTPIQASVVPLVYDKEKRIKVPAANAIQTIGNFRFIFPHDDKFNSLPLDDKHRPAVFSYPVIPYVSMDLEQPSEEQVTEKSTEEPLKIEFTESELQAMEAIGIPRDIVFRSPEKGGLSDEERVSLKNGEAIEINGHVSTEFGSLNVSGIGRLKVQDDGYCDFRFQPHYPVDRKANECVDLLSAKRIGNLELDIFERDFNDNIITDRFGMPVINKGAKELLTYGYSFEPVAGRSVLSVRNPKTGVMELKSQKRYYEVSTVNGCIVPLEMKAVGSDGKPFVFGEDKGEFHLEIAGHRVNDEGMLVVSKSKKYSFETPEDAESYKRGKGGFVKGVDWIDYSDPNQKKMTYTAFAVADNKNNNFPKFFSPETTEKIREQKKEVLKESFVPKKKRQFGLGM